MYEKKFIKVGEICVAVRPTEIVTLLGSCVAVMLYDPTQRIAALNHYLLPLWNGVELQSPKYGNISIPRMIESMTYAGCNVRNIQAKLFGGCNSSGNERILIGRQNVLVAREILQDNRIPVLAEDVEGPYGRRIMVRSDTGKVYLKYTKGDRSS